MYLELALLEYTVSLYDVCMSGCDCIACWGMYCDYIGSHFSSCCFTVLCDAGVCECNGDNGNISRKARTKIQTSSINQ